MTDVDFIAPARTVTGGGGGLDATAVQAIIDAQSHIVDQGQFADLPTADAMIPGIGVPAGGGWKASLVDGTPLFARPGETTWTVEDVPGAGGGNVFDQGQFADVATADAALPGGGVPVAQTWYARTAGGELLVAGPGATSYTVLANTSDVVNQGSHPTGAAADTASGFPGTPVPAGQVYVAGVDGSTATLIAFEGETGYRINDSNQWPSVFEINNGQTIGVTPASRVYIENGGNVVLPTFADTGVSPWITLNPPEGDTWDPLNPPLLTVPAGDTIVSTIPWLAGEVHLERRPSDGMWLARADADPGTVVFQDPTTRTADFTVVEATAYEVDSSGGPVILTVPTDTAAFTVRQVAGVETTVNAPIQGDTSVVLNETEDWVRFVLQPNGLYAMEPLDNWGTTGAGGTGVTLTEVNDAIASEQFPVTNMIGPATFTHGRPNVAPDVRFVFDLGDPDVPGQMVFVDTTTYPTANQVTLDPGPLGARTVGGGDGIDGITGVFYVD